MDEGVAMIGLEEAIAIAEKAESRFRDQYDAWEEYPDRFLFGCSTYDGYGGWLSPFMVMKEDGRVRYGSGVAMMNGELNDILAQGMLWE